MRERRGDFTPEADLVCGVCGAHRRYETAEVRVMFGELVGARAENDCSPGRGGMAQDRGTRGSTFYGEVDRCRESQSWTTACNSMPTKGRIARSNGLMLVRSPLLTNHSWRELASSGRMARCLSLVLSYVAFVLFLFRFRLFFIAFTEAAALRSIVLRYAYDPTATRSYLTTVCVLFSFLFLPFWSCRFSRVFLYHYRLLFVWRVRRAFFPSELCFSTL